MKGTRLAAWALLLAGAAGTGGAGEPVPVLVQSAPGQFEVAAIDAAEAHAVAAVAAEGWRLLAGPLGLPAAFPTPVFVRVLPAGVEAAAAGARVTVESGGVVTVWLPAAPAGSEAVRRALVQGLLARLGVALHGAASPPVVARWLEMACEGWWRTRADEAQGDALKQRTARLTPPPIAALLDWPRAGPENPGFALGAVWLLAFLQAESGPAGEWPALLRRLLAGGDPQAMLAQCYPGRFQGVAARELWWQTGWHQARRVRTLPTQEAEESRRHLAGFARFVFAAGDGAPDQVLDLRTVLARRAEPLVAAELARRAADLGRLVTAMHPFYRNAALSLAEALAAGDARAREKACALFEQDWRDGRTLEEASAAILDRLERGAGRREAGPPG